MAKLSTISSWAFSGQWGSLRVRLILLLFLVCLPIGGVGVYLTFWGAELDLARRVMAAALVSLLAFGGLWWGSEVLVLRQVKSLTEAADRLRTGDLTTRVGNIVRGGEFGRLAAAFDAMAEAFERRQLEHQRALAALEESEHHFRSLIENASDIVAIVDYAGTVCYTSPSIERVLGYKPQELMATRLTTLFHPEDVPQIENLLMPAGDSRYLEARLRTRDGKWRILEAVGRELDPASMAGIVIVARDITERKRAEERTLREAFHTASLARMAARLNSQLDLATVLNTVCEEAVYALNVPAVSVWLYNDERQALFLAAASGLPEDARTVAPPLSRRRYDEYVRRLGAVVIWPDVRQLTDLTEADFYARYRIRTCLMVGMEREGQLIGALTVYSLDEPMMFGDDEVALLQGLADQAAQAIVNARLFDEAARRLRQVQALRTVDIAITSSFDVRLTLSVVLEQVTSQLGVHAADVLLLNAAENVLEFAAGRGFRTNALQYTRLPLGEGLAGRAAVERRLVSIPDLTKDPASLRRSPLLPAEGFVAYRAVPCIAKGQVKGVLEVFHRSPLDFDAETDEFLEVLGGQAAIAIDNAALFDGLQKSHAELILAYESTLEGWSRALDLRDKETEGHTQRVTEMTVRLGKAMGLTETELVHVRRGALLHDIGKMGIPDSILLKPGPLTEEEWEIMRRHPAYAYEMLAHIDYLRPALDIPYCHHEKWDGSGYPRGLRGEQIPLPARIFAVIDVWDALTSDRPYRAAWSAEKVRAHIRAGAGKHFDPRVVEIFLKTDFTEMG